MGLSYWVPPVGKSYAGEPGQAASLFDLCPAPSLHFCQLSDPNW